MLKRGQKAKRCWYEHVFNFRGCGIKHLDKPKPQGRGLTENQVKGIGLLIAGKSRYKVSKELDISEAAIHYWFRNPKFVMALERAKTLMWSEAKELVRPLLKKALEVIDLVLNEKDMIDDFARDAKGGIIFVDGKPVPVSKVDNQARDRRLKVAMSLMDKAFESGAVTMVQESTVDKWSIIRAELLKAVKNRPDLREYLYSTVIAVERQLDPANAEEEDEPVDTQGRETA